MKLLKTKTIALRDSLTLEYVHCSQGSAIEFDPREHMILLHEYDDGVVLEHEKTGLFLSVNGFWEENTYESADRIEVLYCNTNYVRYIKLAKQGHDEKQDTEFTPGHSSLLVEERNESEIKLEPFGTFRSMNKQQLQDLDKALGAGGSLLDPGYDEVKNTSLMGDLMTQLGNLEPEKAESRWISMKTNAGSTYKFTKLGNAKVYVWQQPELSKEALQKAEEINKYRKSSMYDLSNNAGQEVNEFIVIYKSGNTTSFQKYIGWAEGIGGTILAGVISNAIVKLINYLCRKVALQSINKVISTALAEGAERAMTQDRWYVRFWRFSATKWGGRLIGGLTNSIVLIAVSIAIYEIFKFIQVPQQVMINVYNRTKVDLQCSVSYLDNVADSYYADGDHPDETNPIAAMKEDGDVFSDPDLPGHIVGDTVISFGQYQMRNDNEYFEGFGCLLTITTKSETETNGALVSYNRISIPWASDNKMNIGVQSSKDDRKKIYSDLGKTAKATLSMEKINGQLKVKQSINALTGHDHKYISEIGVFNNT